METKSFKALAQAVLQGNSKGNSMETKSFLIPKNRGGKMTPEFPSNLAEREAQVTKSPLWQICHNGGMPAKPATRWQRCRMVSSWRDDQALQAVVEGKGTAGGYSLSTTGYSGAINVPCRSNPLTTWCP